MYVIVDGMGLLNKLHKCSEIKTVLDLANCFNNSLKTLTNGFENVVLVFDQYNIDEGVISLKSSTWESRNKGMGIIFNVTMATNIKNVSLKS